MSSRIISRNYTLKRHPPLILLSFPPSDVHCPPSPKSLWETLDSISPPPPFVLEGGQLSVWPSEKGNQKKINAWGDLKSSCHKRLLWGLTMLLAYTFATECDSWKYWNNLVWLVYDNYYKDFYLVYLFILQASVGLLWGFRIQHHIFSNELKQVCSHSKTDSK